MVDETTTAAGSAARTAATKNPEDIGRSADFYLIVGIMVGVLFLGAIIIWLVDRWRQRNDRADDNPGLSLTNYRALFDAGEITQAEYDRILAKMAPKIKGTTYKKPPSAMPPETPPPGPPLFPKSE